MMEAVLTRFKTGPQGTQGVLTIGDFVARILELPWRNNKPSVSCIPNGDYKAVMRKSPKFGDTYWINPVPGRSWILTHSGNFAGDKDCGFKTHSNGCLLIGRYFGKAHGQLAVLLSKITLLEFHDYMDNQPFTLHIRENF